MGERRSRVEVGDATLDVRMGWAFNASIPRADITNVVKLDRKYLSIGVHGWNGRWLVNGRQNQLVQITIDPATKAKVSFFPVNLRELTVSMDDPDAFVATMTS